MGVAPADENVRQVETALSGNRNFKVSMLSIIVEIVNSIFHTLGYDKVAAQRIPQLLSFAFGLVIAIFDTLSVTRKCFVAPICCW